MKKTGILFLFILLASCSTSTLTPQGSSVRLMKSDPDKNCEDLGTVSTKYGGFNQGGIDEAKIRLKNQAAEKGANYVRWDTSTVSLGVTETSGTAYKCPSK